MSGTDPGAGESTVERGRWGDRFVSRVVEDGPPPRINGYDVHGDLGRHYAFADVVGLALGAGELPTAEAQRLIARALVFLAPASPGAAPGHIAVLAALASAPPSGLVGAAAAVCAEEAGAAVRRCGAIFDWLERGAPGSAPRIAAARDDDDAAGASAYLAAVDSAAALEFVRRTGPPWGLEPLLFAALWSAGLREPAALVAVVTSARLPALIAEAVAARQASIFDYPMALPPFDVRGASPPTPGGAAGEVVPDE